MQHSDCAEDPDGEGPRHSTTRDHSGAHKQRGELEWLLPTNGRLMHATKISFPDQILSRSALGDLKLPWISIFRLHQRALSFHRAMQIG